MGASKGGTAGGPPPVPRGIGVRASSACPESAENGPKDWDPEADPAAAPPAGVGVVDGEEADAPRIAVSMKGIVMAGADARRPDVISDPIERVTNAIFSSRVIVVSSPPIT
jgi:hypothetical protein